MWIFQQQQRRLLLLLLLLLLVQLRLHSSIALHQQLLPTLLHYNSVDATTTTTTTEQHDDNDIIDDDTCRGSSSSSTTECSNIDDHHKEENKDTKDSSTALECHLYMGRSTIPNAGLGIFTGRPYFYSSHYKNDDVSSNHNNNANTNYIGLGDICIPLIDMYTHINFYHHQHHRSMMMGDTNTDASVDTTANTTTLLLPPSQQQQQPMFGNPHDYGNRNWVHNPLRDYFWNGYSAMGMIHGESTSMDIEAYCPGLDCAINCHLGLTNVESSVPQYNDYHSILPTSSSSSSSHQTHRHVHPGTGAYSPYHIRPPTTTATFQKHNTKKKKTNIVRNIPLGGELFKHYGEAWFTTRQDIFGNIPLTNDYVLGENIVQDFLSFRDRLKLKNDSHKNGIIEDLYNNVVIRTIQRIYDTRTLNALPKIYSDIQSVEVSDDTTGMNQNDDGIITRLLQKKHQRSIQELQETGVCLDHIRPDISTIPYAGDGAFATRDLPNQTIITISPLHHIPNFYNFMNMYKIQRHRKQKKNQPSHRHGTIPQADNDGDDEYDYDMDNDEPYYRILDDIQNHQLLMNYCYGHVNSTVLLCPYGSGINYLNHHSTRYNVKLQWIPSSSIQLLQTFQHNVSAVEYGTVEDLFRTERSQLAMQYITTRDIQQGEELFIDYGTEWEMAWHQHVQQFWDENTTTNHSSYMSASYFNTMFGHVPLPTYQEQIRRQQQQQKQQQQVLLGLGLNDTSPVLRDIPSNLQIRCHRALLFQAIGNVEYHYVWTDDNHGVPCRIIDRFEPLFDPTVLLLNCQNDTDSTKSYLYTVQLEWHDENDSGKDQEESSSSSSSQITWILRTDVPRSAIKVYDVPYTSDIHQRKTFRHPIYLSNDVFPKQWRNLE